MTVPELDFHSTDSLVNHSGFYPVEIHVPHHQLRNFISTTYEDKIFFVHNFDIFVLDLQKRQRSLVATVPFEARCLAANHGWVCVGGEAKGDCAFLRIGEGDDFGGHGHDLIVDMLGKDIVNSMTIHRMSSSDASQSDEIMVLISNNDKSVTLYSLSQQEVLCVLAHPVPMNYASMSPDCKIIAAVGDSNDVFFYQRQPVEAEGQNQYPRATYQEYNWRPFAVPRAPCGEGVFDDYSFAVAFSPSGQFCAVSAQGGAISVFDMQRLALAHNNVEAEGAIACTFRSSRASLWGCVRSLAFSPEPWDLLAWTEDHGTIGIADIRRSFVRRQCLSLDRDATEVIEVENTTQSEYRDMDVKERLKHQYMQRMHAGRGLPPSGARLLNNGRDQQASSVSMNQEGLDLDARERSVLEALETTIDDVEHYALRPYSVNYTAAPTITPSATSIEQRRQYDVQLLNPGVQAQEPHVPRRRQSVILSEPAGSRHLSPPETLRAMMTASPAQMSDDNTPPPMSTNDPTPSSSTTSQPMPYNIPPSDPWHVIEAQLIAGRGLGRSDRSAIVPSNDQPASLAQIEAAIYAERQLSNRLERQLADERELSTLLRSELEERERLLEARQQIVSERMRDDQLSPSLERVLQRQLQSEQEHGLQRSTEIENEIVSNGQRVERLMAAREALMLRAMDTRDGASLPTVSISTLRSGARGAESDDLDTILYQMQEERRTRHQRIQDLELQVRRAESRVEIASAQGSPEQGRERTERVADARFLAAATRPGHTPTSLRRAQQMDQYGVPFGSRATPATPSAYTTRLRAAAAARRYEASVSETRSTIPRMSELAGRVSENDMRLARSMLHAAVMDANGNWVAGNALRRTQGHALRPTGAGNLPSRAIAVEDTLRDSGVGTAGIGWSPDGSNLYAGSEIGIFELKVNLMDRMQFPSLEMR